MARGNGFQSPTTYPKDAAEETIRTEDVETRASMLSPGFLSAAAMAGWDEEALLLATVIVEDTPERESKHKRRLSQPFRTPPSTNSRRKRRSQRHTPPSVAPIGPIILDDDEKGLEGGKEKRCMEVTAVEEEEKEGDQGSKPTENSKSDGGSSIPCMDRLREELSCAICLDICFEPSTTSCGHSFCKKCLKSAADKCGKRCPKCRQLISNGRSCTVNTVLWNTIQLLFPEEIEARKASMAATNNRETKDRSPKNAGNVTRNVYLDSDAIDSNGSRRRRWSQHQDNTSSTIQNNVGRRRTRRDLSQQENQVVALSNNNNRRRRMRMSPDPEDDEALALRLQREEFMGAFGETNQHVQPSSSFNSARANLRAMASTFGEHGQLSSSSIAARADQRALASAFGDTRERRRQPTSSFISARENLRAMASRAISLRLRGHPT